MHSPAHWLTGSRLPAPRLHWQTPCAAG